MILSGHQPAYLPWLGYFHKLSLSNVFIYMDTVQYLENDWNNRNKIRTPQGWLWLTVPIDRKKTQSKMLNNIVIDFKDKGKKNFWQVKHWQSIENNYRKSKYFFLYANDVYKIYMENTWELLIDICWEQFLLFNRLLGISDKKIVRMSQMHFEGKKDQLILNHCEKMGASNVVFGKHGRDYVNLELFHQKNINVYFQNYYHPVYEQRFDGFEPYMCILDLLFNCGKESFSVIQLNNIQIRDLKNKNLWE